MPNELKVLTVYLESLLTGKAPNIDTSLNDKDYNNSKINLINFATLESLLSLYNPNPSFSLDEYLYNGKNTYFQDPISTPSIDMRYIDNYELFYEYLLKAIIDRNYIYDDQNNIYIASDELETIIPPEWLFKLTQSFRKDNYKRVYFYHKNPNYRISDEQSLENYLYQVKTFMVTIKQGPKSKRKFEYAKRETDIAIDTSKVVKIDDVIETFKKNINNKKSIEITKFKIPSIQTLITKAGKMGSKFYNLNLEEQQELINTWLLEYLNTNDLAIIEAQKYIASPEERTNIDQDKALIGLFILYIQLINAYELDLTNISLSSFRIKEYASPKLQQYLKELNSIIKEQNNEETKTYEEELTTKLSTLLDEIKQIDASKKSDLLAEKQEEYYKVLEEYEELKLKIEPTLKDKRNSLQNLISYEQSNSIEDLAFDYDTIMNLILGATKQGRIYFNPYEEDELIIEIYNKELGRTTFRCKISKQKLLEFIRNNKLILNEQHSYK